jgi:hypothetical protein
MSPSLQFVLEDVGIPPYIIDSIRRSAVRDWETFVDFVNGMETKLDEHPDDPPQSGRSFPNNVSWVLQSVGSFLKCKLCVQTSASVEDPLALYNRQEFMGFLLCLNAHKNDEWVGAFPNTVNHGNGNLVDCLDDTFIDLTGEKPL